MISNIRQYLKTIGINIRDVRCVYSARRVIEQATKRGEMSIQQQHIAFAILKQ